VLWSEYNLKLPEFLGYVFLTQGFRGYDIQDKKDTWTEFKVSDSRGTGATERISFSSNVADYRWVIKNVRALKEEAFTSTLKNHISKLEFQLSDYRYPLTPRNVMGTWSKLSEDLMRAEYFGNGLDKNNGWLGDEINPLIAGAKNDLEKAEKIYTYVRDNMTCTSHSGTDLNQSLKNILKAKSGTVAEINLLLVAMLKYINVQADPVILSTRSHGYTYSIYPILGKFNYVICDATIGGHSYFLDASEVLGFGKLSPECYNGHARIINAGAAAIDFSSDSLTEKKFTLVMLIINEKGELEGSLQQQPGYAESSAIRKKIKEKGMDDFLKDVKKGYSQELEIIAPHIDSLSNLEENVGIAYEFKMSGAQADIIYINPLLAEEHKENPFKSAERFYPVEMPYSIDETYSFTMILPEDYMVDEMPKPIIAKLNEEGDGRFEYLVSASGNTISVRSKIQLSRTFYAPEEYDMLRSFFDFIVSKQSEQIVLKKKK